MQRTEISVTTPADFNFEYTVSSHGWERLEPFSLNKETQVLTRTERLPSQLARLEITYDDDIKVTVRLSSAKKIKAISPSSSRAAFLSIGTGVNATRKSQTTRRIVSYSFIKRKRLGRLLLAPSRWENFVKTQFLTNTHTRRRWLRNSAPWATPSVTSTPFQHPNRCSLRVWTN
jgi:hypothetical protein